MPETIIRSYREQMNRVSDSEFRQDTFRLLDQVLATGESLEIERHSRVLRVVPDRPSSKLDQIIPIPGLIVGDPELLADTDWS